MKGKELTATDVIESMKERNKIIIEGLKGMTPLQRIIFFYGFQETMQAFNGFKDTGEDKE